MSTFPISQALLDTLPFGVLMVDAELHILYINRWITLYSNREAEDLIGQPLADVFPEVRENGRLQAFELVLTNGQPLILSERLHHYLLRLPASPESKSPAMPQRVHLLPIDDTPGVRPGVLVLIYDQTNLKLQEQRLQQSLTQARLLQEIDAALMTLHIDDCLQIIVERSRKALQGDQAAVVLREGDFLYIAAQIGMRNLPPDGRFPISQGATGWVVRTGVPLVLADVQQDPRYLSTDSAQRSLVAVPLKTQGEVQGALLVESSTPAAFDHQALALLEIIAGRAAIALQNAMFYQKAEQRRAYFQAVFDHSADVIFTLDANLRITTVNAAWDAFAWENGAPDWIGAAAVGRAYLSAITPQERGKWQSITRQLLDGTLDTYEEDLPCHAPDQERWIHLRMAAMRTPDGKVIGLLCSTHDITRRILDERRLKQANAHLNQLLDAMHIMNAQLGVRALLDSTMNFLTRTFNVPAVAFYQWNVERQDFMVAASKGLSEAHRTLRFPPLEDREMPSVQRFGIVSYVPVVKNWARDIGVQPVTALDYEQLGSALLARVFNQNQLAGLLTLYNRGAPRQFSAEEYDLLEALSIQFGTALDKALAFAEQQKLAMTDALTGLANRRQFYDRLQESVERAVRYQESLGLVMLDIDDFKSFNDTYGHPAGDQVLRMMAIVMRSNLRRVDLLARYGGEEFVIILPHTVLGSAYRVAERVRASVEKQMRSLVADICAQFALGKPPRETITISMGLAVSPRHAVNADKLIAAADIALYDAKRQGKNRVAIYQGSGSLQFPESQRADNQDEDSP
ncbi:MAG: hypothetical protein Fur0018_00040 [Anaerolineales bacterium]